MVYRWAKRVGGELERINRYLRDLEADVRTPETDVRFFTREFDDIHRNLLHVLKKVKKRQKEKRRYHAKLKLKNRQRADMISAIAHEFRNPVAAIMGYAQTLADEEDLPEPLRKKFLHKIYANGEKIEGLLERLALWNKFESGDATIYKATFSLTELAEDVATAMHEKYEGRTVEVISEEDVRIEADRTLMEAVLKNLVENALKYSKDRVTVRIERERLCVIDKGVGIAPEEIEKVTKKFYRTGGHTWDNSMGLGLAIVKTILDMHDTVLNIESREREGSVFCFSIVELYKNDEKKSID
jgi:signal transduction histidine kinase